MTFWHCLWFYSAGLDIGRSVFIGALVPSKRAIEEALADRAILSGLTDITVDNPPSVADCDSVFLAGLTLGNRGMMH